MTEVILTRGLPASGKSTWAKAWVSADPSSRVRVNRDDIRFQLYGSYWGEGVDENVVSKIEEAMVKAAVGAGKSVVIDATHLAARYVTRWRTFYPDLRVVDFEEPIDLLVARDGARIAAGGRGVGEKVFQIRMLGILPPLPEPRVEPQWKPAPETRPYPKARNAYVFDIDGTLANHTGIRSPYDTSRYHLDTPHEDVIQVLVELALAGYDILFVSGRDAAFRAVTTEWLRDNTGHSVQHLFMRPEGDTRNDAIVKHELYHDHIAPKWNVMGVFDDRGRVLRMWRAIGLTTFAVGDTDNYNF
jgi:predicted kinase